jgi:hypothetical protein
VEPWPTHPYRQCKHGTYRFVELFWPPISKTSVAIRQFPGRMRLWTLIHGVSKLLLVWWVYAKPLIFSALQLAHHYAVMSLATTSLQVQPQHPFLSRPPSTGPVPSPCVLRNAIFLFICTFLISISHNYSPSWFSC